MCTEGRNAASGLLAPRIFGDGHQQWDTLTHSRHKFVAPKLSWSPSAAGAKDRHPECTGMMNRSSLQPGEIRKSEIKKIINGIRNGWNGWRTMAHLILANGHLRCQAIRWYKTTLEERCIAKRCFHMPGTLLSSARQTRRNLTVDHLGRRYSVYRCILE